MDYKELFDDMSDAEIEKLIKELSKIKPEKVLRSRPKLVKPDYLLDSYQTCETCSKVQRLTYTMKWDQSRQCHTRALGQSSMDLSIQTIKTSVSQCPSCFDHFMSFTKEQLVSRILLREEKKEEIREVQLSLFVEEDEDKEKLSEYLRRLVDRKESNEKEKRDAK